MDSSTDCQWTVQQTASGQFNRLSVDSYKTALSSSQTDIHAQQIHTQFFGQAFHQPGYVQSPHTKQLATQTPTQSNFLNTLLVVSLTILRTTARLILSYIYIQNKTETHLQQHSTVPISLLQNTSKETYKHLPPKMDFLAGI